MQQLKKKTQLRTLILQSDQGTTNKEIMQGHRSEEENSTQNFDFAYPQMHKCTKDHPST